MARYERHVFVCLNERAADHPRGCCLAKGGAAVREAFKQALKAKGLAGRIRANAAGCLDTCESGVSVVIYPEGVWYGGVTPDDVAEIVERHLIRGEIVTRLLQPGGEALLPARPLGASKPDTDPAG
ncbi:MAG: ferredoxin [Acidobacteriota bacterium]